LLLGCSLAAHAAVTGQWDFNTSNLVATVGADLVAQGVAANAEFGSTTALGVPNIGGQAATVMKFPAMPSAADGFQMFPGAAANGSTADVNQYTLIMDILYPSSSTDYRGLFQTASPNNNDADWFVNGSNGLGINNDYHGNLTPDTWHRIALVVDLEQTDPAKKFLNYVDGTLAGSSNLGSQGNPGGRYAVYTLASGEPSWVFSDNDGETAEGYVNSIQFHDVALSPTDIFALGGPSAAGIPSTIPTVTNVTVTVTPAHVDNVVGMTGNHFSATAIGSGTLTYQWYRNGAAVPGATTPTLRFTNLQLTDAGSYRVVVANGLQSVTSAPPVTLTVSPAPLTTVVGQWDFNNGTLAATVGQALQYFDATVQADTSFSTTTALSISDIAGRPASVMMCNPSTIGTANWGGYLMAHGMAPNAGGTRVNQYTVIIDLLYPSWTSGFYRALWQTDPANTNDADMFFNGTDGLGVSYQYDGALMPDTWHRVVLAFDLTKREVGKYLDGTNVLSSAVGAAPFGPNDAQYLANSLDPLVGGGVDQRWSLGPSALLLADGGDDGEVQPVYVSSVQVRSGRMTDAAVAALGAPTADKIPFPIQARRVGTSVVIDWTGTVLESASSLTGTWTAINGATHPHTVTNPTGTQFFRVRP
jgi:hypothetical protein